MVKFKGLELEDITHFADAIRAVESAEEATELVTILAESTTVSSVEARQILGRLALWMRDPGDAQKYFPVLEIVE